MSEDKEIHQPYLLDGKKAGVGIYVDGKLIDIWVAFKSKKEFDLGKELLPPDTSKLVFEKIKHAEGLDKIFGLKKLRSLTFNVTDGEPLKKKGLVLDELFLNNNAAPLASSVLKATKRTKQLNWLSNKEAIDCAAGQDMEGVETMFLESPEIKNLQKLDGWRLKKLLLYRVIYNRNTANFLASQTHLEELHVATPSPILPEDLPFGKLKKLKKLMVDHKADTYKKWEQWAKTQAGLDFELYPDYYFEDMEKTSGIKVNTVHHDVSILEVKKGAQKTYRIEDDVVGLLGLKRFSNNGDLEEALVKKIDPKRTAYEWNSEADTFVVDGRKLVDAKAVIDEILKLKKGG